MKTFKNLAIALVAISLLSTSCVDNEVSPQVEAIRTQQVEWIKAKTAAENALVAYQLIQNDYEAALAIINLKNAEFNSKQQELTYLAAVEQNKVALKNAEVALKQAELNLANQLAALKSATDLQGSTEAATYYANYKAKTTELTALYSQKINKENDIAIQNLTLTTNINLWDITKKGIQNDIDGLNATLTQQKANLVILQSISANPATLQTEKANIEKANTELTAQINNLNMDRVKAVNTKTAKQNIATAASTAISKMNTYKANLKTNATSIIANTTDISNAETSLASAQASLATAQADLAAKQVIYDNTKANYTTKDTDYKNKLAIRDGKQNDYNKAAAAYDIALANWNAKPSDAALTTAKDAALTAKDAAQTALDTAITNLSTASAARSTAQGLLSNAESNLNNSKSIVNSRETIVTNAENTLKSANDTKTQLALEKTRLEGLIAALQTEYNTADANIYKYQQDVTIAQDAIDAIDKQKTAAEATKIQNNSVLLSIDSSISGITSIQTSINTLKSQINITETSIANKTKDLSAYSDSKKYAEAQIANLTKELTVINAQIAEVEKMAAYWKGLLDGILK